jgi:energy-converting hydrogenase Eha subunit F
MVDASFIGISLRSFIALSRMREVEISFAEKEFAHPTQKGGVPFGTPPSLLLSVPQSQSNLMKLRSRCSSLRQFLSRVSSHRRRYFS